MRKLVLFDIDGTLVRSRGAARRAIHSALLTELGSRPVSDGIRFDGKTDPQIVQELLALAGHADPTEEGAVRRVCDHYVAMLEVELEREPGQICVLEGVTELLDALDARADAVVGLLTGNLEPGARLKLGHAGLEWDRFRVGAFGSDADERRALPPVAVRRAADVMGRTPEGEDVVIIGDTPADVTCGAALGVRALAVATGSYDAASLRAAGAHEVFDDLTDTPSVLEAILA